MIHKLIYGTPCIFQGKTMYYNRYSTIREQYLLYCSIPVSPWPIQLYLNRNEFTIKGLKRDKDYERAKL